MEKDKRFKVFDVVAIVCGPIGGEVAAMLFAPNGPTISRVIAWLIGAFVVTTLIVVVGSLLRRES
ncbi:MULTISPECIES: hypothetical protein [Collinsella]|uniref:hypothetical protein n=1 Tax=Collinsella TaxID=102106 RepID=UPI000B38CD11|nr:MULTISPECIES: hypothetical protein [Collinsella]MBM6942692.1 hypothetical protein [Collinsella intestinalis]